LTAFWPRVKSFQELGMQLDYAARLALIYAAASLAYIFLSDWLAATYGADSHNALIQTAKGSGFVLFSAALIYILIRAEMRRQERLRKSAMRAQRLEAIGQLTTVMAHDFNNLLTVIMGSMEMIEDDLAPDHPAHKHVAMAMRAVDSGGLLTRQMLVFARQGHVRLQPVDVNASARQMIPLLSLATGENVTLSLELTESLPNVMAEPSQFENILLNLIINARDAMPKGGEICLSTARMTLAEPLREGVWTVPPGDYVAIAVRDGGHGISRKDMERVLEPFFTTKPFGKGTGLGLTMLRECTTRWSGHVHIASARNLGTTVTMYLPAVDKVQDVGATAMSERARIPAGVARKILVVENETDVRNAICQQLRRLGHKVVEFDSGAKAMKALETQDRVDVLLSDMVLDGRITGVTLARQARERNKDIKVILMSGYSDPELTAEMAEFADLGWLEKPFDRESLQRELLRTLKRTDT